MCHFEPRPKPRATRPRPIYTTLLKKRPTSGRMHASQIWSVLAISGQVLSMLAKFGVKIGPKRVKFDRNRANVGRLRASLVDSVEVRPNFAEVRPPLANVSGLACQSCLIPSHACSNWAGIGQTFVDCGHVLVARGPSLTEFHPCACEHILSKSDLQHSRTMLALKTLTRHRASKAMRLKIACITMCQPPPRKQTNPLYDGGTERAILAQAPC